MKAIGGFYELLLPHDSIKYHEGALALSNGRACIRTIITQLGIKKCYLPNYTCDAVYEPFELEGVEYELYSIDENMEPVSLPVLGENEYFYYINYYGIKGLSVERLYGVYGDKLIIDNTHDFFKKRVYDCFSFTSARKYFGVPDGAFLYSPESIDIDVTRFNGYSLTHSVERLKGNQDGSFEEFQKYEKSLNSEVYKISIVSEKMLSLVDIDRSIKKRKENFQILHAMLEEKNCLALGTVSHSDVPFVYPFLPDDYIDKTLLYPLNIFIPTLWADPLNHRETSEFESRLANSLLPLPIDERYNEDDMTFMAEHILKIKGIKNV